MNRLNNRALKSLCRFSSLLLTTSFFAVSAATFHTFEVGALDDWQYATTGGVSTVGVESHNNSMMAFVVQTGSGPLNGSTTTSSSLSHDFVYSPTEILSFDMHAVANTASGNPSGTKHSGSGVKVSFLNAFNITIGSFALYNYTNPALLAANEYSVDNVQHDYTATMGAFASQAGLNPQSVISKVNLTFSSWAQYSGGGNIYPNVGATASVWFDNVGVVPEPSALALMAAGALFTLRAATRNTRRKQDDA